MSIQNAINSMLSSVERGVALYAYSPAVEEAKRAKEEEREFELQKERSMAAGKRQKEAAEELKKDPENEDWKAMGEAVQQEKYAADVRSLQLMKNRYMRTGDREDLQAYLDMLQEKELWAKPESIETAILEGRGAADARRIEEETGATPEEWEAMAMENAMEEVYYNEQSKFADERVAEQVITSRSQKANFEAHKEMLRRKQYKHTRYQGRKTGGDR